MFSQLSHLVLAIEGGGDLAHEFGHLILDHFVWFAANIEVENDFFYTRRFHSFKGVNDLAGRAD